MLKNQSVPNSKRVEAVSKEISPYPSALAEALAGRESSGPAALLACFPRIIDSMANFWGNKVKFDKYIGDLVFSERIDERQGFAPEVLQDIFYMKELHETLYMAAGKSVSPYVSDYDAALSREEHSAKERTDKKEAGRLRKAQDLRDTDQKAPLKETSTRWLMESEPMRIGAKMEIRRLGKMKGVAKKIGEILMLTQCVSPKHLEAALSAQGSAGKKALIGTILINSGWAKSDDVQRALCAQQGIQMLDIDRLPIDAALHGKLPREVELSKKVVAILQHAGTTLIACSNPIDFTESDMLGFMLGGPVEMAWASEAAIDRRLGIGQRVNSDQTGGEQFKKIARAASKPIAERKATEAATFELLKGASGAEDSTIGEMVRKILSDAKGFGASDIHIEAGPKSKQSLIRIRIDGQLSPYAHFEKTVHEAVVSRIKITADMDIAERRRPQDGKMSVQADDGSKIEARVSTIPSVGGYESVTLRLISSAEPVKLAALGLDLDQLKSVEALLKSPHGMILVCGPTGSGKTTTLHSMLSSLNTPNKKIWTVEDPVEIVQEGLVQTQALPKIGYTFATALRSFMRADPDVIMVGEVRDTETTSAALEASLTGHLVMTTLHTNSACETAVRLLDLGADPFALSDSIRGVIAQRLARGLCSCAESKIPTPSEIDEIAKEHFVAMGEQRSSRTDRTRWVADMMKKIGGPILLREAVGCELCRGSGHRGRIGVHEVLLGSPEIKKALAVKSSASDLMKIALLEGFKPLKARAVELAIEGLITMSEARVVGL